MADFSNTDDIISVSDITDRVEELREELQEAMDANEEGHNFEDLSTYIEAVRKDWSAAHAHRMIDEADELAALESLLDDLRGNGGDHQWEGNWYPATLIRDSYFTDYAQELCEDIGDLPRNFPSYIEIDWEATARNIRMDYSCVEIDGIDYWYR